MRIALSFDDGPNTVTTPQVLDILEQEGIRASFFLIADNINPESAKQALRARAMGCDLENHSRTHGHMSGMTAEQIREEIRFCTERIEELTGENPKFFRPPYIDVSPVMHEVIDLTFICGAGCEDWVPEVPAEERAKRVLAQAEDGQIVPRPGWWMFGGNIADTSDSRWRELTYLGYPLHIHDRKEW